MRAIAYIFAGIVGFVGLMYINSGVSLLRWEGEILHLVLGSVLTVIALGIVFLTRRIKPKPNQTRAGQKVGMGAAIGGALLTLLACGGLALLFAMMDATGTHIFHDFWHSDDAGAGISYVVVGLVAAAIVFVNLWLIARYTEGEGVTLPVSVLVIGGVVGLVIGTVIGAGPFCSYLPSWRGDPCSFWLAVIPAMAGFGIGCTVGTLVAWRKSQSIQSAVAAEEDVSVSPGTWC